MPKNLIEFNENKNVYVVKGSKRSRGKLFSIMLILLCFGVVVFMANSFASFLTVGTIAGIDNNFLNKEKRIYAISLDKSTDLAGAEESALGLRKRGAAGYVYALNGNFYVLASAYKNKADATKVQTNLKEEEIEAEIITITLPSLKLKINLNKQQSSTLAETVEQFYKTYEKLYNLSISFDMAQISEDNLKVELDNYILELKTNIQVFNDLFKENNNSFIIYLKLYLEQNLDCLTDLKNYDGENYSSQIKLTYFKILHIYCSFAQEF